MISCLLRATESTSSNNHRFWEVVSQRVGTRTTKECATFYLQDKSEPRSRGKQKEQKDAKPGRSSQLPGVRGSKHVLRVIRPKAEGTSVSSLLLGGTGERKGLGCTNVPQQYICYSCVCVCVCVCVCTKVRR